MANQELLAECPNCGKKFWPERATQRFCNEKCRYRWHNKAKARRQREIKELAKELLAKVERL